MSLKSWILLCWPCVLPTCYAEVIYNPHHLPSLFSESQPQPLANEPQSSSCMTVSQTEFQFVGTFTSREQRYGLLRSQLGGVQAFQVDEWIMDLNCQVQTIDADKVLCLLVSACAPEGQVLVLD